MLGRETTPCFPGIKAEQSDLKNHLGGNRVSGQCESISPKKLINGGWFGGFCLFVFGVLFVYFVFGHTCSAQKFPGPGIEPEPQQ